MYKLLFIFFFSIPLFSKTFTISSYNVENFFDLTYNGTEYKEYIPNASSKWNEKTYQKKLDNMIKVLNALNADIIALQEIENKNLLKQLQTKLPSYKYISFSKYKKSSVGIGFLSKIKILSNDNIEVKFEDKLFRPILETTFKFENKKFKIFNNHWPSKRSSEKYRIKYAKKLFDRVNLLPKDYDYILLGDFNSNYNEYQTFKNDKKLNDTFSITGINQVLNTTLDKKFITYDDIFKHKRKVHYNLWLDLNYHNRFSNKYRGQNETPDNILLSPALFDNENISYVKNSFKVYKPDFLYKNGHIFRWQMKNKVHKAEGFSDHLPIIATFSSNKQENNLKDEKTTTISKLYEKEKLINPVILKDVTVIYKNKNDAIIKKKNDRAIFLYNNAKNLKEGYNYTIKVIDIESYFGLKEIKKFEILKNNEENKEYKKLYLEQQKIDIFNFRNQNEIITKLSGTYSKGRLYFYDKKNAKKIKIYFKNKNDIPRNGTKLMIKRGHLGYYKNQIQIIVYDKSEIDVN